MIKVITFVKSIVLFTYMKKVKNALPRAARDWTVIEKGRCSGGGGGKAAGRSEEQLGAGGGRPRPGLPGTHSLT